ncbi:FGGY family carbohydrate kinase [Bifidobacterium sp. SO1]|uniref:xylulokinase n=1 Tax=Bifidobacterium sp. SO1 TaxID=2809029 RepID=UPI001BDBBCDF|nr:FGGY family carbohydrate kinase [Bifidobacterium sp. SO1]MBT1160738.1 gluconate kinase [Bifidobacterium sp. SO1]
MREYAAVFDAGTTAIKGALVDGGGRIVASASGDLDLIVDDGVREQAPEQWWRVMCEVAHTMLYDAALDDHDFNTPRIAGIIFSGQMQDVIALDTDLHPVRNAILYSDGRAAAQADALADAYSGGRGRFLATVGNRLEGCLPLPKLMWMRDHEPDAFAWTSHVLISSKDYLIARLAGVTVGDVAACSTAGAMGIRTGRWSGELCAAAGIEASLLPQLHRPQDIVGQVTAAAAEATGFAAGTAVYAGIGDAGATTFASGVTRPGQYNINLGTSGWIATVSSEPFVNKPGAANLAFGVTDGFVNAVPFLNAGDVHRWATGLFADGDYERAHDLIEAAAPGANGVLCLPYLVGERFPVMNPTVRGAYVGLSPATSAGDMLRAALEGVAFSIRQGMASFDEPPTSISLIGGGARETAWCQIMADTLHHPVEVFANADILPAVALASLVFDRPDLVATVAETTYQPDPAAARAYDALYPRFVALYPAVAPLG